MSEPVTRLATALEDRYRIEHELGQGGMATVYLAEDVKHDRKVALKVLRPELAAVIGADRFLNEIKVTANLQHPHILPLHDSGEAVVPPRRNAERGTGGEAFLYYVMPYVEGESLRALLDREKQLGVDAAVELTRAVAGALDYAHRQGVIHRDIKPENILMHEGQAMIADFGIALALSHAGGNRLTETGLSIGTPQYMSPEQAMGDRELDPRSDVYSLAAVLYELLTGEPPYTGTTAQAIVARVITEDPRPLSLQRRTVPPHVAATVHKALSKLPADRFHSAAEFAEALVKPGMVSMPVTLQGTAAQPSAERRAPRAWTWPVALAALAVVAAAGWLRPAAPAPPAVRWHLSLPDLVPTAYGPSFALSHDGRLLAYRAQTEAGPVFRVRNLSQLGHTDLSGTGDFFAPFFSPDGQHLAFLGDDDILRVPVAGGPAVTVTDSALGSGSWGSDGFIYFTHVSLGLARVPEDGGPSEVLTVPDTTAERAVAGHIWPDVLPDANGVILSAIRLPLNNSQIAVLDLETGEMRELFGGTIARYASSGHLVYVRADGAMLAVPFDARRLEVTGSPIALNDGVPVKTFGEAEFTLGQNGTLLYGVGVGQAGLAVIDTAGRERLYPTTEGPIFYPRVSPDGARVALEVADQSADIWVYQFRDSTMSRLTFDALNNYPEWTPDGRAVSWSRAAGAGVDRNIFIKPADGGSPESVLLDLPQSQVEAVWLPDGEAVVVRQGDRGRGQNASIAAVRLDGGDPQVLLETQFQERAPTVSPDGQWLAYVSNESGRDEVYVRPFPGPGGRWQVSSGGGTEPRWARSGREVFYRRGGDLVAVSVTTRPAFRVGQRRTLLDVNPYQVNPNHAAWDVLPGDTAFVFVRTPTSANDLIVVHNWFDELRQRTRDRN